MSNEIAKHHLVNLLDTVGYSLASSLDPPMRFLEILPSYHRNVRIHISVQAATSYGGKEVEGVDEALQKLS
jgi:hypothetical protein